MSVLEAEDAQQVGLELVVVLLERRHGRLVVLQGHGVAIGRVVAKGKVEGLADLQVGEVNLVLAGENDLTSDRVQVLLSLVAAVLDITVDTGEALVEAGDGLEEGGASRSGTALRMVAPRSANCAGGERGRKRTHDYEHHLASFDDTAEVVDEVALALAESRALLAALALASLLLLILWLLIDHALVLIVLLLDGSEFLGMLLVLDGAKGSTASERRSGEPTPNNAKRGWK